MGCCFCGDDERDGYVYFLIMMMWLLILIMFFSLIGIC